jgi:hypothetical protein
MNALLECWHKDLLYSFSDLGICYRNDSIAINPLEITTDLVNKWTCDLPRIAQLARKVTINDWHSSLNVIRGEYRQLIGLYYNKKRLPAIMRCDGILCDNQLKLIEMNIDSSIGGIWEVDFLQTKFAANPLIKNFEDCFLPNPKFAFLEMLEDIRKKFNIKKGSNLVFVGYSDYIQFYKDQAEDICQWITEHTGFNAFFQIPELLKKEKNYITDGIRSYHLLYRDGSLVHSNMRIQPMLKIMNEAYYTDTLVLSDPIDLLIEHKGICAIFHEHLSDNSKSILTDEEKKLIEEYIPWTSWVSVEKKEMILKKKNDLVIKRCCSHAGEYVYIGTEIPNQLWDDLVNKIFSDNRERWIVQENISSKLTQFNYLSSDQNIINKNQKFTLSPFIFGNQFGGLLVRIEVDGSKRVLALPTNSEMGTTGVVVI